MNNNNNALLYAEAVVALDTANAMIENLEFSTMPNDEMFHCYGESVWGTFYKNAKTIIEKIIESAKKAIDYIINILGSGFDKVKGMVTGGKNYIKNFRGEMVSTKFEKYVLNKLKEEKEKGKIKQFAFDDTFLDNAIGEIKENVVGVINKEIGSKKQIDLNSLESALSLPNLLNNCGSLKRGDALLRVLKDVESNINFSSFIKVLLKDEFEEVATEAKISSANNKGYEIIVLDKASSSDIDRLAKSIKDISTNTIKITDDKIENDYKNLDNEIEEFKKILVDSVSVKNIFKPEFIGKVKSGEKLKPSNKARLNEVFDVTNKKIGLIYSEGSSIRKSFENSSAGKVDLAFAKNDDNSIGKMNSVIRKATDSEEVIKHALEVAKKNLESIKKSLQKIGKDNRNGEEEGTITKVKERLALSMKYITLILDVSTLLKSIRYDVTKSILEIARDISAIKATGLLVGINTVGRSLYEKDKE